MAKITTEGVEGGGVLYTWHGLTGESVETPIPLPDCVVEAFSLQTQGASPDGKTMYLRVPGSARVECLVSRDEVWTHGKQTAHYAATAPVEEQLKPPERQKMVCARDGTEVAETFDWKLDARPFAVEECSLELRGEANQQYISEKYPPTAKAAFRETDHLRAVVFADAVEREKEVEKAKEKRRGGR